MTEKQLDVNIRSVLKELWSHLMMELDALSVLYFLRTFFFDVIDADSFSSCSAVLFKLRCMLEERQELKV